MAQIGRGPKKYMGFYATVQAILECLHTISKFDYIALNQLFGTEL